jgi:hypothetical protein
VFPRQEIEDAYGPFVQAPGRTSPKHCEWRLRYIAAVISYYLPIMLPKT